MTQRRALLLAGGACLAGAAIYGWRAPGPVRLDLAPRPGVKGFLSPRGGASGLSGGGALAGLERPAAFEGDLRAALYALRGGAPVAVFTDYRCPNCRRMAKATLTWARDPALAVTFHDWPVLGPPSELAARAAVAAEAQGRDAYLALHERLMASSFLPNPAWLREASGGLGLDADALLAEMESPRVAEKLARTSALARRLGLIGTPSFAFGDVVADGVVSPGLAEALIARAKEAA